MFCINFVLFQQRGHMKYYVRHIPTGQFLYIHETYLYAEYEISHRPSISTSLLRVNSLKELQAVFTFRNELVENILFSSEYKVLRSELNVLEFCLVPVNGLQ